MPRATLAPTPCARLRSCNDHHRTNLSVLTSLRFVAAAMVVIFHCGGDFINARVFGDFFQNGYAAVSFFFVLSGFILTYAHLNEAMTETAPHFRNRFWISRVARIYPVYLIALLIAL